MRWEKAEETWVVEGGNGREVTDERLMERRAREAELGAGRFWLIVLDLTCREKVWPLH